MKRKNKIALLVIVVAIIVGVGSWVLIKKNQAKPVCSDTDSTSSDGVCKVDLGSVQVSTSPTVAASVTPAVSVTATPEFLYRNDRYGFELTLNPAWKGYGVTQRSDEKNEGIYDFSIPTKDSNIASGLAVPLTIEVFTKESYPTDTNLTKITENDQYVFAYSIWNQAPSDSSLTEKDISKVISTFNLI